MDHAGCGPFDVPAVSRVFSRNSATKKAFWQLGAYREAPAMDRPSGGRQGQGVIPHS